MRALRGSFELAPGRPKAPAPTAEPWIVGALCAQVVLAAIMLARFGAGERGTDFALQATARLAFLLFWLAYAGGPLATLFGPRFGGLAARGRVFGLAFAAAQGVHMGLVGYLCWIGKTPAAGVFVLFGIALFWIACLVLFSFEKVREGAGGLAWWIVRRVGMNYILFAFGSDFLRSVKQTGLAYWIGYAPFIALSVAGAALYAGALVPRRRRPVLRLRRGATMVSR
jgi:hypothetical protein